MSPVVTFEAAPGAADTYRIAIMVNGHCRGWVLFVDRPAKRVCRIDVPEMAWAASKSQAEAGAQQLNELYALGEIA